MKIYYDECTLLNYDVKDFNIVVTKSSFIRISCIVQRQSGLIIQSLIKIIRLSQRNYSHFRLDTFL